MVAPLHGIVPTMVTPFTSTGDIDEEGLRSELQVLLASGVHGLAVGCGVGEGYALSPDELFDVARVVVDEVRGRVPVGITILRDSTHGVIRAATALSALDLSALLVAPVHFRYSPGEEGHFAFYREIDQLLDLPLIVDNAVPWNRLQPSTLLRIAAIPNVVGVNQGMGGLHALAELLTIDEGRLKIFSAIDDLLFPSFSLGAAGAICPILTVLPELCVKLWDACQAGDFSSARALHERILPVWKVLNQPDLPARIKAAIELRGRKVGPPRHPFLAVSSPVRAEIDAALSRAGVVGRFT